MNLAQGLFISLVGGGIAYVILDLLQRRRRATRRFWIQERQKQRRENYERQAAMHNTVDLKPETRTFIEIPESLRKELSDG
jgi:hypothetical protein